MLGLNRNPEKLEAKAANYESKGKMAKAAKYRQKAAQLRAKQSGNSSGLLTTNTTTTTTAAPLGTTTYTTSNGPARYEQNALKWEQRGNWQKAQKNREKVWRLQNPSVPLTTTAPMFYDNNNRFLGYNNLSGVQMQGATLFKGAPLATQVNTLPAVVETHVHPTIIQQTSRPERIVEVQPIVHREIDQPSVHVIEKHLYERVPSTGPGVITNQPIVQETLHPRVIEEIQPVVHREVPAPFIERVEQHVTERIVQPTTMTKDVINDGTVRNAPAMAAGGPIGLQQQQGLAGQQNNTGLNSGLNSNLNTQSNLNQQKRRL